MAGWADCGGGNCDAITASLDCEPLLDPIQKLTVLVALAAMIEERLISSVSFLRYQDIARATTKRVRL